ncbi:hypothetical protein BO83DRAFT_136050 [Aspergillus eucalypticola CBS 122712]|uniref:Uncharacterized protein n=1 Tax=Aspergillus eucalypticola (strain CBS 122712 / IBT 29274) TaxID=1448314 RepID=A0A317W8Z8_ASPEC|nr:uncharacterized protein BO83DRAFT_136050 [Aspergillus eucalypticola CBS 122712]PWY82803.1 hypothetical protein BO83DRAFT_136050 [Aspergillus eucalypticola CBS 122712]
MMGMGWKRGKTCPKPDCGWSAMGSGSRSKRMRTRERGKDSGDLDLNSPPAFSRLRLNFRSGPQIVTRRDGVVSNSIRIANDSRIFFLAVNYSIRDVQCPLSAVIGRGEQCCFSRRPFASPSEREKERPCYS